MTENKPNLMSGMRPTGPLHLGNLLGALSNWVNLQDEYYCHFMLAEWHSLMSEYQNPDRVREYSHEVALDWLAAGIDPEKSVIYRQTDVPEIPELTLIFANLVTLGRLERIPTYKEAMRELKTKEISTYGFLGYPVLQAADILIFRAEAVPVGEDQDFHLELTREIARRFNTLYGRTLPEPETLHTTTARIHGTDRRKMSKSYGNCIYLKSDQKEIEKVVLTAITDEKRVKKSDPGRPDVCVVYAWWKLFESDEGRIKDVHDWCTGAKKGCVECKKLCSASIAMFVFPIREKRKEFEAHPERVEEILVEGSRKARKEAAETMAAVREAIKLG
ncbi:MAG: tryptophan--tRNA ligase [Planctomycetota bacterium]|nr:MAG: tryptophan--tRNA ligase [Planctomycetota bacterium]